MRLSESFTGYAELLRLLRAARGSAGLTQTDLSARLARAQSFVSKYERGTRRLDVMEYLEVCEALAISPSQLLEAAISSGHAKGAKVEA